MSKLFELAYSVLVAAQVLFGVFRFTQPDKLQPVHFKLATQQSCSGHQSPDDFAKTGGAVLFRSTSKGVLPSARTWYVQQIQQQCRIIELMRRWSISSLPPTLISVACFIVRDISSWVRFALTMVRMVAWPSTGERSTLHQSSLGLSPALHGG